MRVNPLWNDLRTTPREFTTRSIVPRYFFATGTSFQASGSMLFPPIIQMPPS